MEPTVEFIYGGGSVERFHTMPNIQGNSVARHSFGVAWLVYMIASHDTLRVDLIMAALAHDLAEQEVGDVPAPTKRRLKIMHELSGIEDDILRDHDVLFDLWPDEKKWLKLADCMDGMMFCIQEMALGNHKARVVYARYRSYIEQLEPIGEKADDVLEQIESLYRFEVHHA